jgi:hypothetical protein
MNVNAQPFPLRFASALQPPRDAGSSQWIPAIKGYSTLGPEPFAQGQPGQGASKAMAATPTLGVTTQNGKFTDPPPQDSSSMEVYG